MADLKNFSFTRRSDNAFSLTDGWTSIRGTSINFLEGDDVVSGTGARVNVGDGLWVVGIYNEGIILAAGGSDVLRASGNNTAGVLNIGSIWLGVGNDQVSVTGSEVSASTIGIQNGSEDYKKALLSMGDGNDKIFAWGVYYGIINYGIIDLGFGNNKLEVFGWIDTGLKNYGIVKSGFGNDDIVAKGGDDAISNLGIIDLGAGKDTITGGQNGIWNVGTINMGDGDDIINALGGGFDSFSSYKGDVDRDGKYKLGKGSDVVKGFGDGTFDGGAGWDSLILPAGRYKINPADVANYYDITFTYSNIQMRVTGFERFGPGASTANFMAAVSAGSITFK